MNRKDYDAAKKAYPKRKTAYAAALKKWNSKLAKHLAANTLVLNPNFSQPGQYALRLVVVPEDTDPPNWEGDWKIRLAATQDAKKGKSLEFKLIESERVDRPKLTPGSALPPMILYFNVKRIE
jgi:hypothetical protein